MTRRKTKEKKAHKTLLSTKNICVAKAAEFLDENYFNEERVAKEAYEFARWINRQETFWIQDFYIERGYSKRVFDLLCEKSKLFKEVYEYALAIQEERVLKRGLDTNNAKFLQFVLESYHNKKHQDSEQSVTYLVNVRGLESKKDDEASND